MILKHITQDAGGVVVPSPAAQADLFGDGDLDVVDVVAVPEGFENSVGKAKNQQVLYGFFAQVVIDAVNLFLVKYVMNIVVEFRG